MRWGVILIYVTSRGWTDIFPEKAAQIGQVPEEIEMAPSRDYESRGSRILLICFIWQPHYFSEFYPCLVHVRFCSCAMHRYFDSVHGHVRTNVCVVFAGRFDVWVWVLTCFVVGPNMPMQKISMR